MDDLTGGAVVRSKSPGVRDFERSLLEAQGEASSDGILAVSSDGRILSFNRRFAEMWSLPDTLLAEGSDEAALAFVRSQVADPDGFLARVAYLYDHPEERSHDEVRLADGRLLDRFSSPLRSGDGAPYGRVWFFRDVTDDRRREDRERFLAEAGMALADALDFEPTLERVAELAVPELADWCIVYLREESGEIARVALASADRDHEPLVRDIRQRFDIDPDAAAGVPLVVRTGEPLLVPQASPALLAADARDPAELERVLSQIPLLSWICVPLTARGTTLGAISFVTGDSRRVYGPADLKFAEEVARRAALALDNARLYRRQHDVAETLQRSLLPDRLPEVLGVELAARYVPGSPGVDVGGDWYDAIHLPTGEVALVIGDVAGRGVRAATVMGQLRNAARAFVLDGHSPVAVLERLDRFLESVDASDMATAICAVLDPLTGVLRLATAGHPPALVVDAQGRARYLETSGGPPLGVARAARFREREELLPDGSLLLLYTDGLVERRGEPLSDGLDRLAAAAAVPPSAAEGAGGLCGAVLRELVPLEDRFDDVAILACRLLPATEELSFTLPAEPAAVTKARRAVARFLDRAGVAAEASYAAQTACSEVVANAVEHAYGPPGGDVRVDLALRHGELTVTVADSGRWREEPRGEGGRGLAIVERMMDAVEVHRDSGGTRVVMRTAAPAGGPPHAG